MNTNDRLKRLRFRAWHRGTREADMIVGGFFDAHARSWNLDDIAWFERLMDEQDVDIVAWATGACTVPPHVAGSMISRMQRLDYIRLPG